MSIKIFEVTEKEVCRITDSAHEGGSGRPDCRHGAFVVEVKHWTRRVHAGVIRETAAKPWAEEEPLLFFSTSGFTRGAIETAEEFEDIWLYSSEQGEWELVYSPDGTSVLDDEYVDEDIEEEASGESWFIPAVITGVSALLGVALLKAVSSNSKKKRSS